MKLDKKDAVKAQAEQTTQPANRPVKVRTAVRAGDVYMQYPRGSNN